MNKCGGIYQIINRVDGKKYIGSSTDFRRREMRHFNDLRKLTHDNKHLQNAFNKHGEGNFCFEILEIVFNNFETKNEYVKTILAKEQTYLDKIFSCKEERQKYYNSNDKANCPPGMNGRVHSEESKRKISKSRNGKYGGEKHPMFGQAHSDEAKKKMSEAKIDVVFSNEHKKNLSKSRIGEKNHLFGKQRSDETKKKITTAQSISNIRAFNIETQEEIIVLSESELAKELGVSKGAINQRLNKKSKLYKQSPIKSINNGLWIVSRIKS